MAPAIETEKFGGFSGQEDTAFGNQSVKATLIRRAEKIDHHSCDSDEESAFFVADMSELKRSVDMWREKLPQVTPYYAVKCNNDLEVVKYLADAGVNFDCASKNEIKFVLGLGVDPSRIVYANPCKNNSYIRYARDVNVNLTTVDNIGELYKMKQFYPECGILIRIATDDSTAQCQLSTKFGCTVDAALNELLPTAKELGLKVRGVTFHVGSGAKDFEPIFIALRESRLVFDKAIEMGFEGLNVLDIGGGFEWETFHESSMMVKQGLKQFFPSEFINKQGLRIIAEPGRFMVANVFTLATHVIAKRDLPTNDDSIRAMLYVNDGVYGNLNCILFDHQHPTPQLLDYDDPKAENVFYSVWGPTCDGLDCISTKAGFHKPIQVGDWIYFSNIGAYTSVAATSFNGFLNNNEVIYINQ